MGGRTPRSSLATTARLPGQTFSDGIAIGSFDAVEELLAPDVRFRTLTPGDIR